MRLIGGFIFHIFSNAIAIFAASYFVRGFIFEGDFLELMIAAVILTAINTFLKPILKLVLGPFIVLTLGLFSIVVNALTIYLLDKWSEPLTIQGYEPLLFGTLIVSAINIVVSFAGKWLYKK